MTQGHWIGISGTIYKGNPSITAITPDLSKVSFAAPVAVACICGWGAGFKKKEWAEEALEWHKGKCDVCREDPMGITHPWNHSPSTDYQVMVGQRHKRSERLDP